MDGFEGRLFASAIAAPGGPELDENGLAFKGTGVEFFTRDGSPGERRNALVNAKSAGRRGEGI